MPQQRSAIVFVCEPEYAPGQSVLIRMELSNLERQFVWCGRSLGWLPFETTSNAFFRFFASYDEAQEAADKYVTLPPEPG
jgi:hypothetical protein